MEEIKKGETSQLADREVMPVPQVKTKQNILKKIKNKLQDLKLKFEKLTAPQKALVIGGLIFVFLILSGVTAYAYIQLSASQRRFQYDGKLVGRGDDNGELLEEPEPEDIKDQESPINGILYTKAETEELKKKYPLAIVVENLISARPQSGLVNADIVYEMLAEGGITRFLPIYWGSQAEEVGPVRSARKYMIDIVSEYDAIYKHIGWASDTGNVDTDAMSYIYNTGVKSFLWGGYHWRSTDRVAPHNAYTSTVKLWEQAVDKGWMTDDLKITSWKFKNDEVLENRPTTAVINLSFRKTGGDAYSVKWIYDRDANVYKRENGGAGAIDKVTGLQIEAKTVIAQEVDFSYPTPNDPKNRIILNFTGEGKATVFQDGKAIAGTWKKENRTSRTKFFTEDGKEVELNRGIIWVEMLPVQRGTLEGSLEYN